MSTSVVCLLVLLLTLIVSVVSGLPKYTVTPGPGTTLNISNSQGKGCQVCKGSGRTRECSTFLSSYGNTPVTVEFECSKPEDVFTVEIAKTIACTTSSCNGSINQADTSSLPLLRFNRTFTWNIKASPPKAFKIDFAELGLQQIDPSERCPDKHTYTLKALQATGSVTLGKYCKTGTVTRAQILNQGSLSLDVPAGQTLQSGQFAVSVGEEIKSLARLSVSSPKGASSSELLSANYPDSFPDDDVMEWYFRIPDKHEAAVEFLKSTEPRCLKKEVAVEYHGKDIPPSVLTLMNVQPSQIKSNFLLTLRNCEMDISPAGSPRLSLRLKVSVRPLDSCVVDPSKIEGVSVHIVKLRPSCKMTLNFEERETITVTSESALSFRDCLPQDIQVTATRVIDCSHPKDCPATPVRLLVPKLPSCLPATLSKITWTLRPAQHGTVQLTAPSGPLKQSLPGQQCRDSVTINIAEGDGTTIGQFCPKGNIEKVQIHTNVSVTWQLTTQGRTTGRTYIKHVLNASFEKEISERYIFTVSPTKDAPVLVATPGWPSGMQPYDTVSWIVSVPPKMEAHLMFANLSQPKCSLRHTNIKVQRIGSREEDYSRREDEEAENEITVSENFYLNMSNCMPEKNDFSVITKITLQKSKSRLLTIILSVVAALLVIFIVVLVAVCVVVRKKKKNLEHQVSIYNPNGTVFLPGHNGFPETREDDESHVYASIEDTLVYTHLLKKGQEMGIYEENDTDRPIADSQKPPVSKQSVADGAEVGTYQPFRFSSQGPPLPNRPPSHTLPMVQNEIYQTEGHGEQERSPNLGARLEPEGGN
ncbi:CUB domain-containing protein 1-like isoform X2 [Mugil cephalus]|uniref:CUB domain-containing protein 1-like isoform X2 n=1 Tax=Mugil cephalus TaxID=48193 RepID=UPI001FB8071A|nr:CUB domain-containing protein 1-like isoform X2 [Mugil cephalus]